MPGPSQVVVVPPSTRPAGRSRLLSRAARAGRRPSRDHGALDGPDLQPAWGCAEPVRENAGNQGQLLFVLVEDGLAHVQCFPSFARKPSAGTLPSVGGRAD